MPVNTFSPGGVVAAAAHNQNWALAVLTDTARTITVTHTFTPSQTFTGGWTAGAACTVSAGGLTVTAGGATITAGNLGIGTAAPTSVMIELTGATTSGAVQRGIFANMTFASSGTNTGVGIDVTPRLAAAAFTQAATVGIRINDTVKGAGSATTNLYGLYIEPQTAGGTGNYALYTNAGLVRLGDVTTIVSTTANQLNVQYDASNHLAVSVSSAGAVTFNATGASAGFTFSDAVTFLSTLTATLSTNGDYGHFINNANAGTAAEANLYVANAAGSAAAALAVGVGGTGYTTAGGFIQDAGWVSAGSNLAGGLSLIARGGPVRVYGGAHTTQAAQFDGDTTAGNTRLLVYDVDNGAVERVSVGAADSGGSGFKLLRIPN